MKTNHTKDEQQKAEAYVREQLPELKTRSEWSFSKDRPIRPDHWLKCVVEATKNGNWMLNYRNEIVDMTNFGNRHFKNNYLVIGTKRFYKEFNKIVGI